MIEELLKESGHKLIDAPGIIEKLAKKVSVKEKNRFLRLIDEFRIYSQKKIDVVTRQKKKRQ
jgi:hypothetical protein